MVVTVFFVALFAFLVAPRVLTIKQSRDRKMSEASLVRLAQDARNEARKAGVKVTLRIEDTTVLVLEKTAADTETATEIRRVTLKEGLRVERVQEGDENPSLNEWQWEVYPDGSAKTARLTVLENERERTLILSAEGAARWSEPSDNETPDPETRWAAGEIEQRG
jgi:hypothetical protein